MIPAWIDALLFIGFCYLIVWRIPKAISKPIVKWIVNRRR